jgi:MFS family permease
VNGVGASARRVGAAFDRFMRVEPNEWTYRLVLVLVFAVAVLMRQPALLQDLPPFQFCDEVIFSGEVGRMLAAHSDVTQEFRSGGANIYPVLWLAQVFHVAPTDTVGLTQLGRWVYSVLLASAAVFPIASATRMIGGTRRAGLAAAIVFLLSPTLLAVSRYWYPDHYIVLVAAIVVRVLAGLMLGRPGRARTIGRLAVLALVFALALSVKYTLVLAGLPIALVVIAVVRRGAPSWWSTVWRSVLIGAGVLVAAAAVFLLLNASILSDPAAFRAGFEFNITNYSRPGGGPAGIGFYGFLIAVAAFGPLGLLLLVVGVLSMWRRSRVLTVALISFPIVNVVYLGLQGLVYNRNIVASRGFLIPFVALGCIGVLRWGGRRGRVGRIALPSALALFAALQAGQIAYDVHQDLRPDSQPEAAQWIATHLNRQEVVGANAACSASPAQIAGLQTANDPKMKQHLEYYVFVSYWNSAVDAPFRGKDGVWALFNQKYLHYYYGNDRDLPADFFALPWPVEGSRSAVPKGYRVIQEFDSNGPDVLVLQKNG